MNDIVERLRQVDHGFDRNSSHSEDRYVCLCEHTANAAADEIIALRKRVEELNDESLKTSVDLQEANIRAERAEALAADWHKVADDRTKALIATTERADTLQARVKELERAIKCLDNDFEKRTDELIKAEARLRECLWHANAMANMIRGFIFKTVERETLAEVAAKYRKWEEDDCHRTWRANHDK